MVRNEELLELLACPECHGSVRLSDDDTSIVCPECRLYYAIQGGIPVLLLDQARELAEQEAD